MKKIFALFFSFGVLLTPTASVYAFSPSLSSGLVSYWKLNETTGNAVDATSTNTLINNNAVTYGAGKVNNAANFTAFNFQTLSISDASQSGLNFASGAPLSFAFWFNAAPGSADQYDKVAISKSDSSAGYMFALENGGFPHARVGSYSLFTEVSTQVGYGDNHYVAPTQLDDGSWHHIVVTYDGAIETLYVDGIKSADKDIGSLSNTTSSDFLLGFRTGGTIHNYFDGQIDEVGVWGRALSASDVTSLYNSYTNTAPTAAGVATSTDEDTPTPITLLGSDTDGDVLSFATSTSPAHGTLSTLVGSTTTYTPDANYNGSDSFAYTVSDVVSTSSPATATITINAVNDAPILAAISSQTATSGDTVIFTATSTDVDGSAPTYSIANSSASTTAAINSATGAFSWDTSGVAAGSYVFTIAVSDGATSTATTTTITLTAAPVPTPPVSPAKSGGGGVFGSGPLSVGYQNITNTNTPVTTTVTIKPPTSTPATTVTTAPVVSNQKNTPANNTITQQPQTAHSATTPPAQTLSGVNVVAAAGSNNQLASVASSGFHVPLWVCGAGAAAVAGVGAWWWLGGLAL